MRNGGRGGADHLLGRTVHGGSLSGGFHQRHQLIMLRKRNDPVISEHRTYTKIKANPPNVREGTTAAFLVVNESPVCSSG